MNDCTRFNGNSSKRSRFSMKPKTFILWGPWNSAPDLLKLHPIIVQIFQCGASKMCLMPMKYCVRTDSVLQNKNLSPPSQHRPTTSSHFCHYIQSALFFFNLAVCFCQRFLLSSGGCWFHRQSFHWCILNAPSHFHWQCHVNPGSWLCLPCVGCSLAAVWSHRPDQQLPGKRLLWVQTEP